MTDRPIQDLAALLNEPEPSDPDAAVRRTELAEALRAAMAQSAGPKGPSGQESVTLAAHLEGGLPEFDRHAVLSQAARSPEALADLEASAALLETVAAHPQPVSAEQTARTRAIFAEAQPAKRPRWAAGFKVVSPLQLGFSFAALAAIAAVAILGPYQAAQLPAGPSTNGARNPSGTSAFLPSGSTTSIGPAPSRAVAPWRGSDTPAPGRTQGWTAVALSQSGRLYGAAANWPTEAEAKLAALDTCVKQGGKDCSVAASAQGQCISVAARGDGPFRTGQADNRAAAERRALEACGEATCSTAITRCSGT